MKLDCLVSGTFSRNMCYVGMARMGRTHALYVQQVHTVCTTSMAFAKDMCTKIMGYTRVHRVYSRNALCAQVRLYLIWLNLVKHKLLK